ncbi:MAG TPA: glycosyltransferase family 39 protein [Thermoanaerobaculia bacterium]|nr:glycosyltransferase family 39 protein [Thermoanaerobaculia bacterium]
MAPGADHLRLIAGTAGVLLAILTLGAFLPVLTHGFLRYDDPLYVTRNPHVQAGLTWEGIGWALTANVASNWHPLTLLSHMADCELFGMDPLGHHLTSLLLHTANVLLLFEVLRRMTGSTWRSAAVAALFALHPTHVESVAWIAERKDVLSGLFWILTMGAWARYARQPSRRRYAVVALTLTLGLLSKPMAVTLPFVLLLLDVWPLARKESLFYRVKEKLPLFGLAAASSVVTLVAQSGPIASAGEFPVHLRLANAVLSYVSYLGKTLLPRGLAVFYPMPAEFPFWKVMGAVLLLAALTALAVLAYRRKPFVTVGWLWYLGTLVPVIGLVQVGGQAMADRYTYLPSIGLFLIVCWMLPGLIGQGKSAVLGVAVVLALAVGTRLQLRHWTDNEALFRHAVAVTERNFLAHLHLAQILAERGERGPALEHFRTSLAIRPGMWQTHASLGNYLRRWGRPAEALPHLQMAVRLRPRAASLRRNLALALEDLGRTGEARLHQQIAE